MTDSWVHAPKWKEEACLEFADQDSTVLCMLGRNSANKEGQRGQ